MASAMATQCLASSPPQLLQRGQSHRVSAPLPFRQSGSLRKRAPASRRLLTVRAALVTDKDTGVRGLVDTVWDLKKQTPKYPKLSEDVTADVCVVGAGISGLSIAYNLVKAGKSVVVIDSRTRGSGQTGRTTAHLMSWNDDYFSELEKIYGLDKTKLVADSHKKSIDWVEQVIKDENIECNFQRTGAYLFPWEDTDQEIEKLQTEFQASLRAGMTDTKMEDLNSDPALGSIKLAIFYPGSAEFHVLDYINGLADAIDRKGGKIYEMSAMKSLDDNKVTTVDGATITADAIVLATNSPLNHNLAVHVRQTPQRSYVLGFKVEEGAIKRTSYWSTASPYHYIRLEDTPEGQILIAGGRDHNTGQKPEDYYDAYGELEEYVRPRFPAAGEIVFRWSGQVMKPVDMLGLYGLDPLNLSGKQYIATGDSGQGMTGGTIAGLVISDQILGKENPWSDIYSPTRPPPPSVATAMSAAEQFQTTAENYADRFVVPQSLLEKLQGKTPEPGTGMVIQDGIDRVAVYTNEDGSQNVMSAVCPHLGCLVQYNPSERTFDCACHGSHFDKDGVCINGPAKANLPRAG